MLSHPQTCALESVAGILDSPSLSRLWTQYHHSQKDSNPAPALADQIRTIADNIEDHPELLTFMRGIVDIEREALGDPRKNDTETVKELRMHLDGLSAYLSSLPHLDFNIEDLPQDHQNILHMMRTEAGQVPIRPAHFVWDMTQHYGKHIYEDAKKYPISFTGLLATSLGALYFMNMRLGNPGNTYIDPIATTVTNLDVDTILDPNAPLTFDPSLMNLKAQSCHDHLTLLLGQNGADFVKNSLDAVDLFPQHCSRVKTLAVNAQDNLQSGYDFFNARLALIIKDPATDLANSAIPASQFRDSFNAAAHNTAEFIYAANSIENVVLHTIIFGCSVAATVKLGSLGKDDFIKAWHAIEDFGYRSLHNSKLNYLLCATASTYAYMDHGSLHPSVFWMGAGGALAGQFIHNAIQRHQAPALVQDTTLSIRKDISIFSNPENIVSNARAGEPLTKDDVSSWRKLRTPAIVAGATAIASTIDILATGGRVTGSIMGGLGVTVPFLAYNVPEDALLHIIFVAAGGAVGGAWLAAKKAVKCVLGINEDANQPS